MLFWLRFVAVQHFFNNGDIFVGKNHNNFEVRKAALEFFLKMIFITGAAFNLDHDVDGISVFDKVRFGWVINNRQFLRTVIRAFKIRLVLPMRMVICSPLQGI